MSFTRIIVGGTALAAAAALFAPATAFAAPVTVPTNVTATGTSGDIALAATSTSPYVQFAVDGAPVALVAVANGQAAATWDSYGHPNATHNLTAADCDTSVATDCGTASSPTAFDTSNASPAITAPAADATVVGGFTITGTLPGGTATLTLDGNELERVTTSPFSYDYRGPALSGLHHLGLTSCSTDGSACDGPGVGVDIHGDGLHPSVTGIAPSRFSPNGDKVKDSTTVTYQLDQSSQHVTLQVLNSSNVVVRSQTYSSKANGTYAWVWNGKRSDGSYAPSGSYKVQLTTSRVVNGVTVTGVAHRGVTVDTVAPHLSSISGSGTTFYPVHDGYRDGFRPLVTLSEGGTLRLSVYSGTKLIRTISASEPASRTGLTWNGRRSNGTMVAAGTYRWTYTAIDSVGNKRTTSRYYVTVNTKRLVNKSVTVTKNGDSYSGVNTTANYCTQYDPDGNGNDVWLDNVCDPDPYYGDGYQIIQAEYHFALPRAVRYNSISASAYASTLDSTSEGFAAYFDSGNQFVTVGFADVTANAAWHRLGSMNGSHLGGGSVHVAIGVDDEYNGSGATSDVDLEKVRVTINYSVLQ